MTLVWDSIRRGCRDDFPGYHHEGERLLSRIRYVVLHSTESDASAEQIARYFMNPDSGGSCNIVVDNARCYQSIPDHLIPWGAPPLNGTGWHVEHCGRAAWSRRRWLSTRRMTIRRSAYKTAIRCKRYRIPPRILGAAELRYDFAHGGKVEGGVPVTAGPLVGGIVTHATVSQAFGQTDHTDPGLGFPEDVWLSDLKHFLGPAELERLLYPAQVRAIA